MDFYDILKKAIDGDENSILKILKMYEPLIVKNSIWRGELDEDLKEYITIRIIKNISQFKLL
ncbi:MAG: helix-turn-helix domain-containing protein [Clostridiales bacterium]|nr:helix-turn-helix domain-containing protein [Clostridiales bacterium]